MTTAIDESIVYDLAVLGAGVSGLCLARALLREGAPQLTLALVDGARDDDELRTLSFWSAGPIALEPLVGHAWESLDVVGDDGEATRLTLREYRYRTLFFADLQREVKTRLAGDSKHAVIDGRVTSLTDAGEHVTVTVGERTIKARWVCDSRFRRADLAVDRARWHLLWQHFRGWIVRTRTDAFDARAALFMDFRAGLPAGTAFFYVLPFAKNEALVELVTLESVDAEPVLRDYLRRAFGVEDVEVVAREAGVSPMTEQPFVWNPSPRVRALGIAAGMLKPSTGYALTRILDDTRAIVASLARDGHPLVAPRDSWLFRALDGVFLHLWERRPSVMPEVFRVMFRENPVDRVLRFLDERPSLWDMLALIANLPVGPFVGAAFGWALRRLGFARKSD